MSGSTGPGRGGSAPEGPDKDQLRDTGDDHEITPPRGVTAQLLRVATRLSRQPASPLAKRWLLIVSLVAFVCISLASYVSLPEGLTVHWWLAFILVLVTTPITVLVNAAEFKVMGVFSGRSFGWVESARLTLVATAANLLPIPGGVVVRTQALRGVGATYRRALGANAVAGGAWIGVGALATGTLLWVARGWSALAGGVTLLGVVAIVTALVVIRQVHPRGWPGLVLRLIVVEAVTVSVMALRMGVAFAFLGTTLDLAQAVALTSPAILSAAIGIFPGGLGLREALSGAVAVIVDLPVAQTVAATAVDRIFAELGLALMAGLLLLFGGRSTFVSPPQSAELTSGVRTDLADEPENLPHHGL